MAMADVFLLEDERPAGGEGGEEEAPTAVSALATSLPRDPTMRSSSGGAGGGSSGSDHRQAVAEEEGKRDGG